MSEKLINIFKVDKPNVCFIGDIHGEFKSLQGLMKYTGFKDTVYIITGDCGFGFHKKEYYSQIFNRLTKTASKLNCEFIFVRGNHDSKEWFDRQYIYRKCFKTIPDYSVIQTPTHNILCIGGAISIDRIYRQSVQKQNALEYSLFHNDCTIAEAERKCQKVYWEDESCYYDEQKLNELKLNNINIDIVCTHTSPSFAKPFDKKGIESWLLQDKKLEKDIDNERKVLDNVYNKLKEDNHILSHWFYGHYHYHNLEYINDTKFVMLDMFRNGKYDIYDLR